MIVTKFYNKDKKYIYEYSTVNYYYALQFLTLFKMQIIMHNQKKIYTLVIQYLWNQKKQLQVIHINPSSLCQTILECSTRILNYFQLFSLYNLFINACNQMRTQVSILLVCKTIPEMNNVLLLNKFNIFVTKKHETGNSICIIQFILIVYHNHIILSYIYSFILTKSSF